MGKFMLFVNEEKRSAREEADSHRQLRKGLEKMHTAFYGNIKAFFACIA
jgi:hypothetical protein